MSVNASCNTRYIDIQIQATKTYEKMRQNIIGSKDVAAKANTITPNTDNPSSVAPSTSNAPKVALPLS